MRGIGRLTWMLAALVIASIAVALLVDAHTTTASSSPAPAVRARPALAIDTTLLRDIARRHNPTVVAVRTRTRLPASPDSAWFEWFFGRPLQPKSRLRRELGSGFLISANGDILTNDHVIAGADVIEIGLLGAEAQTYRATVVGRDPLSDSALLRVQNPPGPMPFARLGDSNSLAPGDWVMAIGHPFRLGHTVTVGVVSYQGRPFEIDEGHWEEMIQTDASINPGNSGGPLIDLHGDVVGINTAILDPGIGGGTGIGFAVPINTIKALLPQLRTGTVVRGRVGARFRSAALTDDEASALGLPSAAGALIMSVERDSPASKGGLHPGDVIIAFDGAPVATTDDLLPRVSATKPGTRVRVIVVRHGRQHAADIVVDALSLDAPLKEKAAPDTREFGLTLADLTTSLSQQLALPRGTDGAVVYSVQEGSPAAAADLQQGDVIRRVNRHDVHNAAEASRELAMIQDGHPLFLLVWRQGTELLLQLAQD